MTAWKGKTRGGLLGYKIFVFVLKKFGLGTAYVQLRFVAAYFVVFAPDSSASIYWYFRNILNQSRISAGLNLYLNYYIFGQTLVDKLAIGAGLKDKFSYSFDGKENLDALGETGGIVLSAHVGNWDTAGYLLKEINAKTNILMFEAEHEHIKAYLKKLTLKSHVNIIPIKPDLSHIFLIRRALDNREIVCVHGDRFLEGSRVYNHNFMGREAAFPAGPFSIISKLKAPYTIAFACRGNKRNYLLSSTAVMDPNASPEEILENYVQVLEEKMKTFPNQWFNYYDFWERKTVINKA